MTSNVTCYGGPLNCHVVEAPDPTPVVAQHEGGHYRLIDGAYHWHTGQPAEDGDQDTGTEDDAAAEVSDVEHVRPAPKPVTRKPRARTRGK